MLLLREGQVDVAAGIQLAAGNAEKVQRQLPGERAASIVIESRAAASVIL